DGREDRTEDLLAEDRHLRRDVGEDGRLEEIAFARSDVGARTARNERGAFLLRHLDVAEIVVELFLRRDGAEPRARVEGIAAGHLLRARRYLLDELVLDGLVDEQPRSGGAHFPLAVEDARRRAAHRGLEIRVRKNNVRRLAAELQR